MNHDNLAKARAAKAAAAAARASEPPEQETAPVTAPATETATAVNAAPEPPASEPSTTIGLAAETHVEVPHTPKPDAMPKTPSEKVVEVELLKPYAPEFIENDMGKLVEQGEIKAKLPKGLRIKLPASEATRALRLQIAIATENTFA